LGRFQIVSPLGQGGMATVYKAFQPALDRYVALKLLRAGIVDEPEQRERFEREAKAIARLRHPSIVQVFDFDTVEGQSFLVMEFIDGGTLKNRMTELSSAGKRLPRGDVGRIVGEIADALDTAHHLGIVHRDVKPSNVLMSRSGRAIMADFGIARILASSGQTQTGVGVGTPEYMSPEQGEGLPVDQQSDIYSLGVMAYELLTGRVPFRADTPLAVVLAHVRDPLPLPSTIDPTIGEDVERVLLKAMAKTPSERYATAGDFAQALSTALSAGPATGSVAIAAAAPGAATASTASVPIVAAAAPASTAPATPAVAAARPKAAAASRAQTLLQWEIGLALRVIGLLFLAVELLLIARAFIRLIPTTFNATMLALLDGLTAPLVAPFEGIEKAIFADPAILHGFDLAAAIALVVVFVLSRLVDRGGRRVQQRYAAGPRRF
jgi:serine/threonine-protein kinase